MGTGLAIVCAQKGYSFVAVMSRGNSSERIAMMRALGAKVILVNQSQNSVHGKVSGEDLRLVELEAQRLTKKIGAFRADQFEHEGNRNSHYTGTAEEFWRQSEGLITAFCDFVGSGGTYSGCSMYFKEKKSSIKCFVVEPEGASILSGKHNENVAHAIQGGGYSMSELSQMYSLEPDGYIEISDNEAIDMARKLACKEGIFAGFSTGANVSAALKLIEGELQGGVIGVIACDSGLKYLSTDLWS